jgi:glutamate racemase
VNAEPLGVFDSGLGGLTVVRALRSRLPAENIVYLGDTARVPYGTRSEDTILRYARSCAAVLMRRKVKALVIACNTASAVALEMLRAELDIPVVGVIDPGAAAAVHIATHIATRNEGPLPRIGVLATARTIATGAYTRAVGRLSTRLEVVGQAAPLLVPLVEEGWVDGDVPRLAVERYLAPLIAMDAGVIVLGCTHYPVLRAVIEDAVERLSGRRVPVVDSAEATATAVAELLRERGLETASKAAGTLELLVTDVPATFSAMADRCLGGGAPEAIQIDL